MIEGSAGDTVFSEISGPKAMRFPIFLHSLKSNLSVENLLPQVFFIPVDLKIRYQSSSIIREGQLFT